MRTPFFILAIAISVCLSGCATIISGSRQQVRFSSTPAAATIFIDEVEVGKTPFAIRLDRKKEYHVMFKLDGFKTYETNLTKKFNAWYIGNLAFGGVIGLIIDPLTGAMYNLTPKEINAQLDSGIGFHPKNGSVYIAVALQVDPNWVKVGQLDKL
jgi:uncharacterized protein YceK